jgi:glutathione S-transferase
MNPPSDGYVLYAHIRSGNAYKAALMLALTATTYRLETVDLNAGQQRTPAYRAINPFGQVPTLRHGERIITQSNAILIYLGERSGKFWPSDPSQRIAVLEWLFWEQETLFPGIGRTRFFTKVIEGEPAVVTFFRKTGERGLSQLENQLAKDRFVVGPAPTVADISIYAYARLAEEAGFSLAERPKIVAWRQTIEALSCWAPPDKLIAAT